MGTLLLCGGIMTIAISLDVLDAASSTHMHATLTLVGLVSTISAAAARMDPNDGSDSRPTRRRTPRDPNLLWIWLGYLPVVFSADGVEREDLLP